LIPTIRTLADSGIGVLLIEQFATVALGLANRVYVMESGRLVYSGTASELREKPELLHSAYLLRGSGGVDGARTVISAIGPESSQGPSDRA
jgi:branched-chain amino acid transport system ATP-binding protein